MEYWILDAVTVNNRILDAVSVIELIPVLGLQGARPVPHRVTPVLWVPVV